MQRVHWGRAKEDGRGGEEDDEVERPEEDDEREESEGTADSGWCLRAALSGRPL